jgi:hypothetical protein
MGATWPDRISMGYDQQTIVARTAGLRVVLAKPAYRRLFAAQTNSRWGDTFNTVALVVLVFRLTGKGLGVTGVVIAEILPVLLLAPLAGVLTDRLPRVQLMVAADLWHMTLAGLLPLVDQHLLAVYLVAGKPLEGIRQIRDVLTARIRGLLASLTPADTAAAPRYPLHRLTCGLAPLTCQH